MNSSGIFSEMRSARFLAGCILFVVAAFFLRAQENLGRGRITGTVVDEKGNPIEGASILAQSLQAASAKLEGKSDERGRFAIAGLGTGPWRITASKSGYVNASEDMDVRQLRANPPMTLTLKKATGLAAFAQDKSAASEFDLGTKLLNEGKTDEALKIFEEFQAKFPEIYQVHLNIGACYLKKSEWDKATAEFQIVLDKTLQTFGSYQKDVAASIRALSGLGEVAVKKNDFATAQKYFSQALEVSPEDEMAAYNVGEIFFSNQNADEAIKYFELATKIKKDWPRPYYRLGLVYLNKGDYAKSLEYLTKFIEMAPDDPDAAQAKNMIATIEKIKK
jgi:tetratricopeptide (TPR) repeat protein